MADQTGFSLACSVTSEDALVFSQDEAYLTAVHYVNVSVVINFSQKTSVFTLNYHKFSIKSYVLDVY